MRKKFVVLSALLLAGTSPVFGGTIHFAPDASPAEKRAGYELGLYYRKVTGKSIYFKDNPVTVYIGKAAKEAPWFKETPTAFEEWVIQTKGDEIVITGDIRGAVWGVYEFIEKYLGCRFYANDTEFVPSNPAWTPPAVSERKKPAFMRREMSTGNERMHSMDFHMRRKESVRSRYPEIRLHHGSPHGSHTFAIYLQNAPNTLRPARGSGAAGRSPCYSDPETIRFFADKLAGYIAKDRAGVPPEAWRIIYDVSQNDGYGGNCLCPECRKIYQEEGAVSGGNLRFVNAIAAIIEEKYPDVLIQTFAYQHTMTPPKLAHARKNVIVRICNSELTAPLLPGNPQGDILEGWTKHADKIAIWSYWKSYTAEETPFIKPREVMQRELQFCRDKGVMFYYAENEHPYKRSFYALQYYLWSKLTVDPDVDVEALTDEFLAVYYGKGAPAIKKYLEYMEKREKAVPFAREGDGRSDFTSILDREFFAKAEQWLDEAERLTQDDARSNLHVRWERIPVDHARLNRMADMPLTAKEKELRVNRWFRNETEVAKTFFTKWHDKNVRRKYFRDLDLEKELFEQMPFPTPPFVRGRPFVDLHWPAFNPWGSFERSLTADPEASSGKAFELRHDVKKPYVHQLPLSIGVYDERAPKGKKFILRAYWGEKDIPADEKYHWRKLAATAITPDLSIYIHRSWGLHLWLRAAITGIAQDVPKEIWISLKITGPAYVKGSKKPNGIFVDRIIVLTPEAIPGAAGQQPKS